MRSILIALIVSTAAIAAGCQSDASKPPQRCSDPGSTCELERPGGLDGRDGAMAN